MILKYALFTLIISMIPLFLIWKDFLGCVNSVIIGLLPSTSLNYDILNKILFTGIFSYFFDSKYTLKAKANHHTVIFSKENLNHFNGLNGRSLYLAILGNIFDVSNGVKYYGPGETYNGFIGKLNILVNIYI